MKREPLSAREVLCELHVSTHRTLETGAPCPACEAEELRVSMARIVGKLYLADQTELADEVRGLLNLGPDTDFRKTKVRTRSRGETLPAFVKQLL